MQIRLLHDFGLGIVEIAIVYCYYSDWSGGNNEHVSIVLLELWELKERLGPKFLILSSKVCQVGANLWHLCTSLSVFLIINLLSKSQLIHGNIWYICFMFTTMNL